MVEAKADLTELREEFYPKSLLSTWSQYNLVTRPFEGLQVQTELDIHQ